MATKYETVADIIAERDTLRRAVISAEGQWVGHKELVALRKDAERYRWLRDLLAVEDIHEALMNRMGVDDAESLKCDAAVDECMAHDARRSGAA